MSAMDSNGPPDRPEVRVVASVAPVGALLARIAQDCGLDVQPRSEAVTEALGDLIVYVDAVLVELSDEVERQCLAAGLAALSHHVQLASLPDATPSHRPTDIGADADEDQADQLLPGEPVDNEEVALAVVTSPRGVLVGRRRSGIPRWVLPGGKIHPDEPVGPAAARECAEETGLAVVPSAVR
jgi:hypothetical protein